ncbi:MAG: hypothetical protein V3V05_05690 [Pontiella sp.]
MNLKLSLVNLFLSPIAVGIARQRARARKHENFFYRDIAIYCAEDQAQLLKDAVDAMITFYGEAWVQYQKNLKRIVLDDELQTILWVARRTIIIQESDERRMSSLVQLTGGLIFDCERVQVYRENHCATILWKKGILSMARNRAELKRLEYVNR